ncbi:hypothetical protein C7G42_24095 [Bradyrhizobium sp. MOS003]|nr:hypothetical protein C7G42_24095 [Bradyrhizobium sp. MOS003]
MTQLQLDYLAPPRKISCVLIWTNIFDRGVVMGVIEFFKSTSLGDEDCKGLQNRLVAEKT